MHHARLYIDGKLNDGAGRHDVESPATGEIVGQIAVADIALTQQALVAAENAFPHWSSLSSAKRAEWMRALRSTIVDHEEQLRECVHLEMGKPWRATADDYDMLVDSLTYYADLIETLEDEVLIDPDGTHEHLLVREPLGVVGAFLAWNFPLLNLAYKLGPAMAAGCPLVVKPSIKTPLSAYLVGQLCAEIGLPAGVVNIVAGPDHKIGDTISRSPIPQMLTLIGSTNTGKHIIREGATTIKRYSMELGGNAPVLIFEDADLDKAADTVSALKFGNSGQICVAPNRVFVQAGIAEEFQAKLVERATDVSVGYDRHAQIDMGPLMDGASWERIHQVVQNAVSSGANLVIGGGRPDGLTRGHFYAPTILSGVRPDMKVAQEEVFGPVVSLLTFEAEEDAIRAANDTDAGLTAYVFTSDRIRADRCASALRFGEVQINGVKYAINLPHGGFKQSGIGVDCSPLALDDYLVYKRISRELKMKEPA